MHRPSPSPIIVIFITVFSCDCCATFSWQALSCRLLLLSLARFLPDFWPPQQHCLSVPLLPPLLYPLNASHLRRHPVSQRSPLCLHFRSSLLCSCQLCRWFSICSHIYCLFLCTTSLAISFRSCSNSASKRIARCSSDSFSCSSFLTASLAS